MPSPPDKRQRPWPDAYLYADFGDVRNDDFQEWWKTENRGAKLFSEKMLDVTVQQLHGKDQWSDNWSSDHVAVVAIGLHMKSRRQIMNYFGKLLKTLKVMDRGKPSLRNSTAPYPLHKEFALKNLKKMIDVYDAVEAAKMDTSKKTPLWKIGNKLNLVSSSMPAAGDNKYAQTEKRHIMSNTVSRLYKRATNIIKNTAQGRFPDDQT